MNNTSSAGCSGSIQRGPSKCRIFFQAFMQVMQFFRYGNNEIHNIFIKLKEIVQGIWREVEDISWGKGYECRVVN